MSFIVNLSHDVVVSRRVNRGVSWLLFLGHRALQLGYCRLALSLGVLAMSNNVKDDLEAPPNSGKVEEPIRSSAPDWEWRKFIVSVCSVLVGFLGVIVAATIGYFNLSKQVSNVQTKVNEVGNRVESVEKNALADRLIIISPGDGESVDSTAIVRGKTPYPERNHYIVVTPLKTNDDWIQKNLIKPDPIGSWAGNAEFGTGDVGIGEKFLVRVLATSSTIPSGQLKDVPPDAIPSDSITVTRKK
ncbi:MAG TPA: hypothetical protein VF708_12015 [Pyrinomonadaceae bacterium]